jgi:hypothetical protein
MSALQSRETKDFHHSSFRFYPPKGTPKTHQLHPKKVTVPAN